ncbi:MAG: M14 family metallopeptidase [Burkholderiaceae bacterium]
MGAAEHFAQSYVQARANFLQAAESAGLDVEAHAHPLRGRDGEMLAMDVAFEGGRGAPSLLILSSACHGVEGYCGSGVQTSLLHDAPWHAALLASGVAVLYIHALNPYGFSWWRRTTQENVDLNRNFHDFSKPLPKNPRYDELAHLLVPSTWPPTPEVATAIERYIAIHGQRGFQEAVSGGQYEHPEGLFFGGHNPTWSHVTLRHVLQEHGRRCARLAWIDLHTGLGPTGAAELIAACRDDDVAALERARNWWGKGVTSLADGSSISAPLQGLMWQAAYQECAQAQYTGMAMEYGTLPVLEVMEALRADQWLENHPEADAAVARAIKRRVRDAFYTDTDAWKEQVLSQAHDAAHKALTGLAG